MILVEGTSLGVVTNAEGYFVLERFQPRLTIYVSFWLSKSNPYNIIVKSVGTLPCYLNLTLLKIRLDEVVIFRILSKPKNPIIYTNLLSCRNRNLSRVKERHRIRWYNQMPGISPPLAVFEMTSSSEEVHPTRRSIIWMQVWNLPTSIILALGECWWSCEAYSM